ncbi:MAG: GNAT family N-acetyltransferase [Theionarchaea archaeon]|nr:GNAT family N-acetyltransferase [Theionarchaea archaeon]
MEYRFLKHESLERIYRCFIEAFSDYLVEMQPSLEKFKRMLRRNGVNLQFSMGAYDHETLVGFILNGTGSWKNMPTLYDSGTAMIRTFRGKSYTKMMFEILRHEIIGTYSTYLLEVIQENRPAYNLYHKQGFVIERELACFSIEKEKLPDSGEKREYSVLSPINVSWKILESFWTSYPSWQNSIPALKRINTSLETIGVFTRDTCIGYGFFTAESGEIHQIAVRKDMRRRGIGTFLLNTIASRVDSDILKVINVDRRDQETIRFFEYSGFINDVNQYEMKLHLD